MKKTLTIFISLLVFAAGYFVGYLGDSLNRTRIAEVSEAKEQSCRFALEQFSTLYQVISSVGQIPYDSDFANCYDHSKLMTKKLAESNIMSSIMVNEDRSHSWVAVWIEATTGQFMPIEDKVNNRNLLEIRDGRDPTAVQCYNSTI